MVVFCIILSVYIACLDTLAMANPFAYKITKRTNRCVTITQTLAPGIGYVTAR